MKTIFDWLTMPAFRERTAMYLGRRDPVLLDTWMFGYQMACKDAGEYDRLRTNGGVPIDLLRDYIAMRENDTSSNGIPNILREAVGERDDKLVMDRFFSHVDALMQLSIISVQHTDIPPEMKPNFVSSPENMPTGFRKVSHRRLVLDGCRKPFRRVLLGLHRRLNRTVAVWTIQNRA